MAARLALLAVLSLAGLVLACGGDDDDDSEPTQTRTAAATRSRTPTPGADEKTPGPEESPIPQETPVNQVTAPPPASEGTSAVEPPDTTAFLLQFLQRNVGEEECIYTPATRLTDCGGRGLYAVNPPLGGEDIGCFIGIVDGNPEYIRCSGAQPVESKYYAIQ